MPSRKFWNLELWITLRDIFHEIFLKKYQYRSTGDNFPNKKYFVFHFGFKSRRGKCLVLPLASYGPGPDHPDSKNTKGDLLPGSALFSQPYRPWFGLKIRWGPGPLTWIRHWNTHKNFASIPGRSLIWYHSWPLFSCEAKEVNFWFPFAVPLHW